jgi:hypothetical protein
MISLYNLDALLTLEENSQLSPEEVDRLVKVRGLDLSQLKVIWGEAFEVLKKGEDPARLQRVYRFIKRRGKI